MKIPLDFRVQSFRGALPRVSYCKLYKIGSIRWCGYVIRSPCCFNFLFCIGIKEAHISTELRFIVSNTFGKIQKSNSNVGVHDGHLTGDISDVEIDVNLSLTRLFSY